MYNWLLTNHAAHFIVPLSIVALALSGFIVDAIANR